MDSETAIRFKKRVAVLDLCRPKARPWSETEVNHLLWSIDSNASVALMAERLAGPSRPFGKSGGIVGTPPRV